VAQVAKQAVEIEVPYAPPGRGTATRRGRPARRLKGPRVRECLDSGQLAGGLEPDET